jgi:predicted anti-sigma-YlaC factor YlaD
MRDRALFDDERIRDDSVEFTVARAIQLLLRAWEPIMQEGILEAWSKIVPLW